MTSDDALLTAIDRLLRAIAWIGLEDRDELDALDDVAGDGDFGTTLGRGAVALIADPAPGDGAGERLRLLARTLSDAMGGSSGAMVGIGLLRAGGALEAGAALDRETVTTMVRAAIDGIHEYGGAERGDKTLLDALFPLLEALAAGAPAAAVVEAAHEGAQSTAHTAARRGRAAYAAERSLGAPDPGAVAVARVSALAVDGEVAGWDELAARVADAHIAAAGDDAAPRTGFVDRPSELVADALDALVLAHPDLVRRLDGLQVVVRADGGSGGVALLAGGGSGHEPMHAGFVGPGMLDAAVAGAVFTSPPPGQVHAAARAVATDAGVLFVVKRYTGDILNFRLASELAAADGISVETVIVDDDVAIPADAPTGRRGTGVTIAVERIAGARAAQGGSLAEVAAVARRVVERGRSYGVAIHGDEIELGVGIHGEPGRARRPLPAAATVARALVEPVWAELPEARTAPLLVLLSGLGGTPPLELQVLFGDVCAELARRGGTVARSLVGDLITSLAQPGAVLSVVALDDELTALWDAPLKTAALRWG